MVSYLNPDRLSKFAFDYCHHLRFAFDLPADYTIDFPVSELFSGIYNIGTLLNTIAEFSLVFPIFRRFSLSRELLGQINILDFEQSQIDIVIQRFSAYHFFISIQSVGFCVAYGCIQRPSLIKKLIFNISEKFRCFKATVIAATVLAMFKVYFLAFVSLISDYLAVVKIYRTTPISAFAATLKRGNDFWYSTGNVSGETFAVDGNTAYCVNPLQPIPGKGNYTPTQLNNDSLMKVLYYGYGGIGFNNTIKAKMDSYHNNQNINVTGKDLYYGLTRRCAAKAYGSNYKFSYYADWNNAIDNLYAYVHALPKPSGCKVYVINQNNTSQAIAYLVEDEKIILQLQKQSSNTSISNNKNNKNFTDVSIGDTVDFALYNSTAGSSSMKLTTYAVYDKMSKGLTFDKNSVKVFLADKDKKTLSAVAYTNYTLNITSQKDGQETEFNVALTKPYLAGEDFYDSAVEYVLVTYSAVLNKHAVVGIEGNPNEDVELKYGNDSHVDSVPGNEVFVYTYGIGVTKLNEDGKALAGAKFGLYKTEADASKKEHAIAVGTSDTNGKVVFLNGSNEEMKVQSGNYFIAELEAPEGYNVYGKVIPISVEVSYLDAFTNNTWVENAPKDGFASVTVTDTKLIVPQTGGYVQYVYLEGVLSLIIGGAMFLVSRKIKNR